MFKYLLILLALSYNLFAQTDLKNSPKSDIFMQGFYWNSTPGGAWYDSLSSEAARLASAGFSAVWLPSPSKGAGGGFSMGYDPYDHYDFGEFNQKGSRETRFGSKNELINVINNFHEVGISVFADAVLRHMMGGEVKTNYECRPMHNGNYIVPDSAFLIFNYPNGSGRFKKNASSFYPNSQNCWVDPLFVQIDPLFRFGEWLDHNKPSVKDSLVVWGKFLRNVLGFDGFRLDAVKAIDPAFMAYWLNNSNSNGYAVAELWGSISEIGSWLNICKNVHNASVSMFDFPLRYELKYMCNNTSGGYDMQNLDNAGLINAGISGFDVATFVENHDFDRVGYDGQIDQGHDPIIYNKDMAYAYTIFSEGRPCVFYKDYFHYGFAGKIDTLNWIRINYLSGNTSKRNELNPWYVGSNASQTDQAKDIYVARRNGGNGKPQAFLVINDNSTEWRGVWVNSNHPNKVFRDFTGRAIDKTSQNDGRVELWAPPRGYAVYVPDTTNSVAFPPVLTKVTDLTAYTNSSFQYLVEYANIGSSVSFNLQNKPNWLNISSDGLLWGTPGISDTGNSNVILTITNQNNLFDVDTFQISVIKNLSPFLQSINDTTVKATFRFEIQATANDPDGDSLNFFFSSAPQWLNIVKKTGLMSATPSISDTGLFTIKLKVTDFKGAFDSTSFNLIVKYIQDTLIATYGKPIIDGNIFVGNQDWLSEWQIVADSDTDSYWHPVDSLDNELLGIFATWDADSLYLGVDYVINDIYNTMMLYIDNGFTSGVSNFNSNQGYNGDYAKNFRFRPTDNIDFFIAAYYRNTPLLYSIKNNSSENISDLANLKRGANARGLECALSWNDIYNLGNGLVQPNAKIKLVSVVSGGFNYGGGDSAPDNQDINGDPGPDSLINLAVISIDIDGNGIPDPTIFIPTKILDSENTPTEFSLFQNFPNPFNPTTNISFSLPKESKVKLSVYDILGREVAVLVDDYKTAGIHAVQFNAASLSSGIYLYQLQAGSNLSIMKLVLLK